VLGWAYKQWNYNKNVKQNGQLLNKMAKTSISMLADISRKQWGWTMEHSHTQHAQRFYRYYYFSLMPSHAPAPPSLLPTPQII